MAFGLLSFAIGYVFSARVGMVDSSSPTADKLGLGLGFGLLILASGYASVVSRGSSSLTPIALMALAAFVTGTGRPTVGRPGMRTLAIGAATGLAVLGLALLMAVTVAPSARNGVQPVEFMDEAYYALLAVDLSALGRESIYSPAAFATLTGLPDQTWYHWGEAWLGAAVLNVPEITALHARHLVVLPLIVVATISLAGSVSRRLSGHRSTETFLLGAVGMLLIAPIPLAFENHFDRWASPFLFAVTQYGLVSVAILALLCVATGQRRWNMAAALVVGMLSASLIALHIALVPGAIVASASAFSLLAIRVGRERVKRAARDPAVLLVTTSVGAACVATVAWGFATGHGLGAAGPSQGIGPFDDQWRRAVLFTTVGAACLLAAPLGALALYRRQPIVAALLVGGGVAYLLSALAWGALFPTFNAFHVFFGTLVLIVTPVAVAGICSLVIALRADGHRTLATGLLFAFLAQVAIGGATGIDRLITFGPGRFPPIALEVLQAIRGLPAEAKLAYACQPFEEFAFWDPILVSIKAHTGRSVVPMCFQEDVPRGFLGGEPDPTLESPFFGHAPQRDIYPTAGSVPSEAAMEEFLRQHGIEYVWVDALHSDRLVNDADPVYARGDVTIFRVPWAADP